MGKAEFAAWLHGSGESQTLGMQCLIERNGTNSDQAPETIGMLTDAVTRRPRRRPTYKAIAIQKCATCLHEKCRASALKQKQVVCRSPLGTETRLDLRPPPLHASRSASGVAASECARASVRMGELEEAGTEQTTRKEQGPPRSVVVFAVFLVFPVLAPPAREKATRKLGKTGKPLNCQPKNRKN